MSASNNKLLLVAAPFFRSGATTRGMMVEVLLALVPVVAAATWFFGISALLVVAAAVAGAALTEWAFGAGGRGASRLLDGSAVLTGVLLALTLPPGIPLWMAALGGSVSIGLGKTVWGGLGRNLFNPALVGRAFLQAAFPGALTTWTAPGGGFLTIGSETFAPPLLRSGVDVVSTATPLGAAKFEGQIGELGPMLWGNTAGSLGETSAIVLALAAVYLLVRRTFDWRLLASTVLGVLVFGAAGQLIDPGAPGPLFQLLSGGLLFGAVFMVTDPVTSPVTPRGSWYFGFGVAALVVLIRLWGGLPEGVMYAILLMNAVTPLINRRTQPRPFGG